MKYPYLIVTTLIMLFISVIRSDAYNWHYTAGVNESGLYVAKDIPVLSTTKAMQGMDVSSIDADPQKPGHVVIKSRFRHDIYASDDQGKTWTLIKGRGISGLKQFIWLNGLLVTIGDSYPGRPICCTAKTWAVPG